jgi:hypothetical protein
LLRGGMADGVGEVLKGGIHAPHGSETRAQRS